MTDPSFNPQKTEVSQVVSGLATFPESVRCVASSFRDPSGFVFHHHGKVLRAINQSFENAFNQWIESGLYRHLQSEGWLIPHTEVDVPRGLPSSVTRALEPRQLNYVSYASEWSFSQLRDAALVVLKIQESALEHGFTLKDAPSSNIQFWQGRPVWIDSLSFEALNPEKPWTAYRQFCSQFLAPLALMSTRDPRLGRMCELWQEGLPLDLVSELLPRRTWLRPGLGLHLHGHGRAEKKSLQREKPGPSRSFDGKFNLKALHGLVLSLRGTVENLSLKSSKTTWDKYYDPESTSAEYLAAKRAIIGRWLQELQPSQVWDLGGNDGEFSRLATKTGANTVCFDFDANCVERNYLRCRTDKDSHLLPLQLDLANPSPARGWDGTERPPWYERGKVELVMTLALVHHLALTHHLPLPRIALWLARFSPVVFFEFVPKSDPKVQWLLHHRGDVFPDYHPSAWEEAIAPYFRILRREVVGKTDRMMYWIERTQTPSEHR